MERNIAEKVRGIAAIIGPLAFGLILTLMAVFGLLTLPASDINAAGPDEAEIVIQLATDEVIVRHISFTAPISGYEALRLTGLDIITTSTAFGPAVCSIEGVGDPAANCFDSGFWSYYFWNGTDWESYLVGASGSVVNDGAVELWSWQEGFVPFDPLPSKPQVVAASNALEWLRGQQSPLDGGYGNQSATVQALLAIGANQLDADAWRTSVISPSLLDYWSRSDYGSPNNATAFAAQNAGRAGLLALAASGAKEDPQNFAGLNLVISMTNYYSPTTGMFDQANINQAWAMLGWQAAGQTIPVSATQHLVAGGTGSGGWEWTEGIGSDTNTTALALQALIAGGECITSPNVTKGLDYLKFAQNLDGGFGFTPFSPNSDTNSTAWTVQALLAAGEDPTSDPWTINNTHPISYLLSIQLPDGSFEWQTGIGSNQLSTQQAIPALFGQSFPVHLATPDQSQCFVSPPTQAPGDFFQHWLPIISKS